MPIEGMTRSEKCIGIIERKVITDMRRAFPESKRFSGNTNCMCFDWPRNSLYLNSIET